MNRKSKAKPAQAVIPVRIHNDKPISVVVVSEPPSVHEILEAIRILELDIKRMISPETALIIHDLDQRVEHLERMAKVGFISALILLLFPVLNFLLIVWRP